FFFTADVAANAASGTTRSARLGSPILPTTPIACTQADRRYTSAPPTVARRAPPDRPPHSPQARRDPRARAPARRWTHTSWPRRPGTRRPARRATERLDPW